MEENKEVESGAKPEDTKLDDIGERFEAFRHKQASEAQDVKVEQPDKADESVTEKSESGSTESPEKESEEDKPKLVPLDALHQSREKFKKLNLEHREYKTNTEKKLAELESLVKNLHSKNEDSDTGSNDNEEVISLRKKVMEMEERLKTAPKSSEEDQYKKSLEETRKWINDSDKSLDEEGFPGFKIGYPILAQAMKDAFDNGELTEADLYDKAQWIGKYKEIFPEVRVKFDKVYRTEVENKKKEAKKKAGMVSNPGKAPEKPKKKEGDDLPKTHDEWVKQSLQEHQDNYRKSLK